MTQLFEFNRKDFENLALSKVKSISPALLRCVCYERNSWYGARVRKYAEGCMHADRDSAVKYAERMRTPGSFFNIIELPAVIFRSRVGCVAVTQINTNFPLCRYSSASAPRWGVIDGLELDNYVGARILDVDASFRPGSGFWKDADVWDNPAVVVATDEAGAKFSEIPDRSLIVETSYTRSGKGFLGSRLSLGWYNQVSGIERFGVDNVVSGE